jgi:hypothetical protein
MACTLLRIKEKYSDVFRSGIEYNAENFILSLGELGKS